MAKKFETLVDDIFGAGTAEALTKGTGELRKKLLAEGVEQKKKDAETVAETADAMATAEATPPTDMASRDQLLMQLIDGMEAILTETKNALAATEVAEEKADAVEEEMKALRKEIGEIREQLKMKPRVASQSSETELEGAQAEKAKERIAPPKIQKFGGLEIVEAE